MTRTSLTALLLPTLLLLSADARAVSDAACCLQSTSRLDSLVNPVKGGDEDFFTTAGGAPNILFVLDTSTSMYAWPKSWPTSKGCEHAAINDLGYDPSTTYPSMWKNLTQENSSWFNRSKVYDFDDNGFGTNFQGEPDASTWSSTGTASGQGCYLNSSASASDRNDCKRCLETKGYYIWRGGLLNLQSARRATGNFLNFYAPRDSGAVMVLSQIIRDLQEVRMGMIAFRMTTRNTCWDVAGDGYNRTGDGCVCLFQEMGPKCSESWPLGQSAVEHQRNSILQNLQNKLGWGNCGTPLPDMLYAAGYYLGTKSTPFSGGSSRFDEPNAADRKTVCSACGFNAVVLLTDGDPNNEEVYVDIPSSVVSNTVKCGNSACYSSKLDEVARYLWENDMRSDYGQTQKIATYTIGFSQDVSDSGLLRKTAEVGGGRFYPATSTSELRSALTAIVDDVVSRNTSFSSANIASLQTGSSSLSAVMPRMSPQRDAAWRGELYRFSLHNEFVLDEDRNGDGDKDDIFVTDTTGAIVVEDSAGAFVRQGTTTRATPVWEARSKLLAKGHAGRTLYTVIDDSGPSGLADGALTHHDSVVEFSESNLSTLLPYLGIQGNGFCPSASDTTRIGTFLTEAGLNVGGLLSLLDLSIASPTQAELDEACARAFIRYVRGQDVMDEDGDGNRTETRESVLGDIFHSSPIQVDPPVERFICDIGLHNQCVRTLYSNGTPLAEYDETRCDGQSIERDAYDSYMWRQRKRDKLVLVGANDGMLHAFHNGEGVETCTAGASTIDYAETSGTGEEVWAFIPPDLLPRLQEQVTGHAYFVDGDIMVRDIWADDPEGGTLGTKDRDEFHTLAIAAEGRGGTHYFALELRFDENGDAIRPGFRWMFPQPCTDEASLFGKTLYALSPRPPPVGPVLLDADALGAGNGVTRDGVSTVEQWVTMLSGGWSPALEKGRGVYMVDAWWGVVNGRKDNLWWKFENDPDAAGEKDEPQRYLTYSVVAPVAMVDYGDPSAPRLDGFFDTGVVGDTGGQIWTLRFSKPGILDTGSRLISNWSGARTFEQDRDAMGANGKSVKNLWPFHFLASVALQPDTNILRAFAGTGDRYSVLDEDAGQCRFDNPLACAKYGCGTVRTTYQIDKTGRNITQLGTSFGNQQILGAPFVASTATRSACGNAGETAVTAGFSASTVDACPDKNSTRDFGDLRNVQVKCGLNADGTAFACKRSDTITEKLIDLDFDHSNKHSGLGRNRFYGFHVFGGTRVFDETKDATGESWKTARHYDANRLTDRTTTSSSGDLVDVTATSCNASGACTGNKASGSGLGWMFEYPGLAYKTATGGSVLASCVLWNSIYPSGQGGCGNPTGSKGRVYQADFITGEPNCAASFKNENDNTFVRYQERELLAPPPEPATAVQISKTGAIKYSSIILEPGKDQATEVSVAGGSDVLQSIYVLPVTRGMHKCRHEGKENCVTDVP